MILEISVTLTGLLKADILVELNLGQEANTLSEVFLTSQRADVQTVLSIHHGHFLPHYSQANIQ
jgi:hypothetical protein